MRSRFVMTTATVFILQLSAFPCLGNPIGFREVSSASVFDHDIGPLINQKKVLSKPDLTIENDLEWKAFWTKCFPGRKIPFVDFSKERLLVVVSSTVGPSDGHSIKLESIDELNGTLILRIVDSMAALTSEDTGRVPITIIALPVSTKPVKVELKLIKEKTERIDIKKRFSKPTGG